jgi:hypothetical protein
MTDDEIRSLVRVAIQKHLGPGASPTDRRGGSSTIAQGAAADRLDPPADVASGFSRTVPVSISFGRYALPRAEDDTMCIIEPAVTCNHCGYCQCHGH